ncbi:MAG: hypothetical protein VYB49_05690 [Actinomycetota bacterium]|nr:hypothetical protein [Actinomycetota bacterium]
MTYAHNASESTDENGGLEAYRWYASSRDAKISFLFLAEAARVPPFEFFSVKVVGEITIGSNNHAALKVKGRICSARSMLLYQMLRPTETSGSRSSR